MMKLYYFDKSTGEYLRTEDAPLDPITNSPMKVRGSTFLEPPKVKENQKAVFSGDEFSDGEWKKMDDYRGTWYKKTDGSPMLITTLGVSVDLKDYTSKVYPGSTYLWDKNTDEWIIDSALVAAQTVATIKTKIMNHAAEQLQIQYLVGLGWMDASGNVIVDNVPLEYK